MLQQDEFASDLFPDAQAPTAQDQAPDAPSLDKLRSMYRQAFMSADESRRLAFRDCDYYHGHGQLHGDILAEMKKRRQPPKYNNKIRPGVQGVLGLLDSGQTDPEATGRNDVDEDAALLVTEVLRYLADQNEFEETKRTCSFDLLVHGIAANITEVQESGDARVTPIPFQEFFFDPYSLRADFLDARYMGRAKWTDASAARRLFPDAYSDLGNPFSSTFDGSGPEDQPEYKTMWLQADRRRVLLVELYYIDEETGEWMQAMFCHAGVLKFGPCAYQDDEGNTVCPITAVSYEVDRMGDRYGMVRDMVPIQDSINARTSKMLWVTNNSQIVMTDQASPTSLDTARKEAQRADGVIPYGYTTKTQTDVFEGNHMLLNADIETIERMAPSPALLGRVGGVNESGRARQILQQAGLTELARAFARWENWELRTYKQMWFRTLQFMNEPRLIRITDRAGSPQNLQVNVPTGEYQIVQGPDGQPVQQPVLHNELASMDMDVTLKTVRQADSLRQEAIDAMLEFAAKTGTSILSPEFELVIEMSEIPNKQWLLEKYRQLKAQAQQEQAGAQQAQQAAAQNAQAITAAATQSKAQRDQAQAQKDQAMAEKHLVDAHDAAFDLAVKQAAFKMALDHQANPRLDLNAPGHSF